MQAEQSADGDGQLYVENIGGIDETAVKFSPGVTVLVGRNATNRTSLLQAFMAACGSDDVSIKGDAEEGRVELALGEETFTRRLQRRSGTIISDGEPYLANAELADLFAFLLESNEARRAVATGADLRNIIMRPVDTDAIQAEIDSRVAERQSLESTLQDIEERKADLPGLEEKRAQLREEIEAKKSELDDKEAELAEADEDLEDTREEKAELEEKLQTLRSKRSTLDDIRYDLETEEESLSSLEQERQELEGELEKLPDAPTGDVSDIEATVEQLRDEKQTVETQVRELQTVIGFNEELLADTDSALFDELGDRSDEGDVTDELLEEDEIICWTCGNATNKEEIEAILDNLRELSQDKIREANGLEDEIEDLVADRRSLEDAQRRRNNIEQRLRDIETELQRSNEQIAHLRDQRTQVTEEIERLEAEVEDLENEDYSAILDLHREANQLEYEIGRLEANCERIEDDIADVEARIEEQGAVETELEELRDEIRDLRTRIDRIEERAVDEFNENMETVLDLLDYSNLERIWIERVERDVRDGRQTVEKTIFELHVIRTTESGTAYEDTIDHLSESEREVTGLIFALSGYLAHEVYNQVPFMLLDSLEAFDPERISALVEYFREHADYLIVALLPEDASVLDGEFHRITEI